MTTAVLKSPVRKIICRFFPRKYLRKTKNPKEWALLDEMEKKELALHNLSKGELALLQGNLAALPLFEAATSIEPKNPSIWYRQGLAFFEYGSEEGKENALLLASKYFKFATKLDPNYFEAYVAWGNTLLQLGKFHEEHHFHLEAKEKYQKALKLSSGVSDGILSELYWDYGIVWAEIASHSGEAADVYASIQAFEKSLKLQEKPAPEILHECGKSYLEMGLLINDMRFFAKAIKYLERALEISPSYLDAWTTLSEVYSQSYMNTMDDRFILKATECYAKATKLSAHNSEIWLNWAQILGEAGRVKSNIRFLRESIEHCARAFALDRENPATISQWVESLSWLGNATTRLDLLVEAEKKILKASELYSDDPDVWHAYGVCLLCFGKYYEDADYLELAIEKINTGLSINRSSAEHWYTLALVHKLYADLTHHEDLSKRANRFFEKAMDLKPFCPSIIFDSACSLHSFSDLTRDLPSLEKAIDLFEFLLKSHKRVVLYHPEWLVACGKALESLSDFNYEDAPLHRAIEIYTHVLLIDPDYREIYHRIALANMNLGHNTGDPEFYKRALSLFTLAAKADEENDQIWLDWGICSIHLAHHSYDFDFMHQLYLDAEKKIGIAGRLGNHESHYSLACLYSILGRTGEAMELILKALHAKTLPPIEEMLDDEWLENLKSTEPFIRFVSEIEHKIQTREE